MGTGRDVLLGILADVRPTHIVHLAGQTRHADPAALVRAHQVGTRLLIHLLGRARPWLLVTSSSAVYGAVPDDQLPISERVEPQPVGDYAMSKLLQERVLEDYGGAHCVFRLGNLLGPGQSKEFVIGRMVFESCCLASHPDVDQVLNMGDLSSTRDFVDCRDVAVAIVRAVEMSVNGLFNIASGREVRLREVALSIRGLLDGGWRVVEHPDRAPHPIRRQALDISAAKSSLGWEPGTPLLKTLSDMVAAVHGAIV